jgi:phosphoenolpyruvate synthase/pyruvate phosphate dikinase
LFWGGFFMIQWMWNGIRIKDDFYVHFTDEGGITCHAAIVARELNKPCIIGTKIATQVLKDGMLVEVDANEGIVKILEI